MEEVDKKKYEANIWKYYFTHFFFNIITFIPVMVVFYKAKGLTMTEILLLQSIYSIAIVLLEVPTGTIGDYFSKKLSITSGIFIVSMGLLVYSFGNSFLIFLIAEIMCGLGSALISGSDKALLHHSLKKIGRGNDYKKISGRIRSIAMFGVTLAGILGGFIAKYSLNLTILVSSISTFIAFIISCTIYDDKKKEKSEKKESFKKILFTSIKLSKEHKLLRWVLLYSAIIFGFARVFSWYYQPYFTLVGIPIIYFGIIYFVFEMISILGALSIEKFEKIFPEEKAIFVTNIFILISIFGLVFVKSIYGLLLFIPFKLYRGIAKIIINHKVLELSPSSKSATILSIRSLGERFTYALIGPVIGYITDVFTLQIALLCLGIIILVPSIVFYITYKLIPEHFHEWKTK